MSRVRFVALVLAILASVTAFPRVWGANSSNEPGNQEVEKLVVADLSDLSVDDQMTFTALQGMVNREKARIYYVGLAGGQDYVTDPSSELWLKDAVDLPVERVKDPFELLQRFRGVVKGLVIWDPGLKVDTQNVATTISGLEDYLPASPELAEKLTRPPHGFEVKQDLRKVHFLTRAQAYEWALSKFGTPQQDAPLAWLGGTRNFVPVGQPGLRDFIVARRGFAFEAEPINEAWLVERILSEFPAGTFVYGYPFVDDLVYFTTSKGPVVQAPGEPTGVTEISLSGKQLVPSTDSANLTVHSSFPSVKRRPRWDDRPREPEVGTTYVTFVITDGDNLGWNQQRLRIHHWEDQLRGTIPVGVSISPLLATHAPKIYEYYLETMTKNEVFVAGPSGAGYIYPGYHTDLDRYLDKTKHLMDLAGLRSVWILDYGYLGSPSPATTKSYVEALSPSAIFADYGGWVLPNPPEVAFSGDVPVLHAAWGENVPNTVSRIRGSSFAQLRRQPYAFVFVALVTSSMSFKQAHEVMAGLAEPVAGVSRPYEAVRPDHFIGMIKYARESGTQFPRG